MRNKLLKIGIKLFFCLNIASLTLLTTGCSSPQAKNQNATKKKQVLRVNNRCDLASAHPHYGVDFICRQFQLSLFEGLTRISPDGSPTLACAEFVDISPCKTHYTFILRPLKWSNGKSLTAYHFESAWKLAVSPTSKCLRPDLFYPIKNAQKAIKGEVSPDDVGVKAIDAKTLVVELEHPTPYFFDLLANTIFSPLYDDSEVPTVFNGPFLIQSWEPEKLLVLAKNNNYWDAEIVKLDRIEATCVRDTNTSLLMYEKGELDWAGHPFTYLPYDALDHLRESEEFASKAVAGVFWLCLNTESFPLNSVKIRKALSIAIDREEIAKHVMQGEMSTKSLIPITMSLVDNNDLYNDKDEDYARQLFQEGLQELNITSEEFPVLQFNHSDIAGQKKLSEAIVQKWEKVLGIKVDLIGSEWNVFFSNQVMRQFQIGGCNWFSIFHDPIYNLEFFKEQANRYNWPGWENKQYTKLLDLADKEIDLAIRNEHLRQAELLLLDEMPIIPLFVLNFKYLKPERAKGLFISDLGYVDFKWGYIE